MIIKKIQKDTQVTVIYEAAFSNVPALYPDISHQVLMDVIKTQRCSHGSRDCVLQGFCING